MLENLRSFSFCRETRARVSVFFSLVGEASEYFREIGGLMFINDLAKSSVHCIVKEAALFTLGIIIESNGNKIIFLVFLSALWPPVTTRALSPFSSGLTK